VSYLGGPGGVEDWGLGLAWSHDGIVALCGISDTAFRTSPSAVQPNSNGLLEAFVATLDPLPANARRVGSSTPGCRGSVWLQVNSDPAPGNAAFELIANGAPTSAPGGLAVGLVGSPPLSIPNLVT